MSDYFIEGAIVKISMPDALDLSEYSMLVTRREPVLEMRFVNMVLKDVEVILPNQGKIIIPRLKVNSLVGTCKPVEEYGEEIFYTLVSPDVIVEGASHDQNRSEDTPARDVSGADASRHLSRRPPGSQWGSRSLE